MTNTDDMKRITVKDIEKLNDLYLSGDYNSLKVVWSQLNEALDWIDLHASLVIEESKMTESYIIEE